MGEHYESAEDKTFNIAFLAMNEFAALADSRSDTLFMSDSTRLQFKSHPAVLFQRPN
jgi:hypothetical protein